MADEDRTTVRTYVPTYQKDEWQAHAENLDMSLSEFVRTMVQAGRNGFTVEGGAVDPGEHGPTPGGNDLETALLDRLTGDAYVPWEELIENLTSDIEDSVEEALEQLQQANRVTYSGRHGGYTLTDE